MNQFHVEALEIVGFNGTPTVDCGRTLAVVRNKADGMYCVLGSVEGSALTWHDEEEAAEFLRTRRWTRLHEPLPVPPSCRSGQDASLARLPMVVHVSLVLLRSAGHETWPAQIGGESVSWQRIETGDDSIRASCGPHEAVEALMGEWALGLQHRFDAMYRRGDDPASLKSIADFMLCAARTRSLRWQAYLRYAMAQKPERVRPIFEAFTRKEFPRVTWEEFLDEFRELDVVLKAVASPNPQTPAGSSPVAALHKLRDITRRKPRDVRRSAAA